MTHDILAISDCVQVPNPGSYLGRFGSLLPPPRRPAPSLGVPIDEGSGLTGRGVAGVLRPESEGESVGRRRRT